MMPSSALRKALAEPTPEILWDLRGDLLERGVAPDGRALTILGDFASFLDGFATATSSRDLNHLASKLDIGAIGGVFLEQIFERPDSKDLALRMLTGSLSEGLMVLASRQYVRAQEGALSALFRNVAWTLHHELWLWTTGANPELEAAERRTLIDGLLAPLRDPGTSSAVKAVLAGRIFQVLLLARIREA